MLIETLAIREPTLKKYCDYLIEKGITKLNPPQEMALSSELLSGKNCVVCSGTGSGKTLIAEFALLKTILEKKSKVVYLVPLKALATEKYQDFKEKFAPFSINTAISIGDLDSGSLSADNFDILICTYEKFDSLLRHNTPWLSSVDLVVVDELHELNDESRGPTLEVLIVHLLRESKQILALSATVGNADELAGWLKAELVQSDFRPVKLYEGIASEGEVAFENKDALNLPKADSNEWAVYQEGVSNSIPSVIFLNTRREAESLAERVGKRHGKVLSLKYQGDLEEASEDILDVLSTPTKQCRRLAYCISLGTAFHHAGLPSKQRHIVESLFREGKIIFLASTVTLVAGLNLPCRRVIIRSLNRFSSGRGMQQWPISLYKQAAGRAGRPQFDSYGEAIIISKKVEHKQQLIDKYIYGEAEPVFSKLGVRPTLRIYTLALISSAIATSKESLIDFFKHTFYAHQYSDMGELQTIIDDVTSELCEWGFLEEKADDDTTILKATLLGKRINQLYIDPLTGKKLREKLHNGPTDEFGFLQSVCDTFELRPRASIKQKDWEQVNDIVSSKESSFLYKIPTPWDLDFDMFLSSVKLAKMLEEWIDEKGEDDILENFDVSPGELFSKLDIADWLLYAAYEICKLENLTHNLEPLLRLRVRLKYGVRKELVPLVRIKHIGRVKARKLYLQNIRSREDISLDNLTLVEKIIGKKTAAKILGLKQYYVQEEKRKSKSQKTLFDF